MHKFTLAIICLGLLTIQAQPDRWRGLVLSETTPEQAIAILGAPKESKPRKIRVQKIGEWLSREIKQELPCLRWEGVAGMKTVDAYFLNGKLAALDLQIQAEVRAAALDSIYGVKFQHLISHAGRVAAGPDAYQRDRGETFSNTNEVLYHVGAKAERAFLVAWCEVGFGEGLKNAYGAGTDTARPGKVRQLQMYSRALENRDGADVLSSDAPAASKPNEKTCYDGGRKVACP